MLMTELLEKAVKHIRSLPPHQQDELARMILSIADFDGEPALLSAAERQAIGRSKAAAARGEFASAEELRALWERAGL